MAVPAEVMHHVVRVESSFNPYAIGVVGGRLVRQPKSLAEALATVRMLEERGYNFSLGLAQVNRYNLEKYGLDSYEKAFETCPNLQAGSRILAECYHRSRDWGKSFSCYYSGDFVTGYRHGYVQKVYASIRKNNATEAAHAYGPAIEVISRPSRRAVAVTRYPMQATAPSSSSARMAYPAMSRSFVLMPAQTMPVPAQPLMAKGREANAPGPQTAVNTAMVPQGPSVATVASSVLNITPDAQTADRAQLQSAQKGDEAFVF